VTAEAVKKLGTGSWFDSRCHRIRHHRLLAAWFFNFGLTDILQPSYTTSFRDCVKTQKSHPREWVDCSDSTYEFKRSHLNQNPTNGSWWMVQVQPIQPTELKLMCTFANMVQATKAGLEQSTHLKPMVSLFFSELLWWVGFPSFPTVHCKPVGIQRN